MDLNLQKTTIATNEVIMDEIVEQSIECDAILPDYQPDISKILKCSVLVNIGSADAVGRTITMDGTANIKVFYLSENDGIRRGEYKVPFTKTVEMPKESPGAIVTVTPSTDFLNCRAISERRMDIRGAVSLVVKASERKGEEIISGADGGGVQLRQQMVKSTELSGQIENTFTVSEELELPYGKEPIMNILRHECHINVTDCKLVAGRIVAKADLVIHVTYLPQNNDFTLQSADFVLPISQIIEAEGVDDESVCNVLMNIASSELQPKANENSEYSSLTFDSRIKATIIAHRNREVPVASDCYSTEYACSAKQRQANFMNLEKILHETIMHRDSMELPDGVTNVLDSWATVDNVASKQEGNELVVIITITVSMFAKMQGEKEAMYFEQSNDIEQRFPVSNNGKITFEPSADIISNNYNVSSDNALDIRCEIALRGCIYCNFTVASIVDIEVDENLPCQRDQNKLILYFADKGESIWDIAKNYKTSANAIWDENSIDADILPDRCMLMIPVK